MTRRGGRTTEPAINAWMAEVIQDSGWCTARPERTRTISGHRGKSPDIIVRPNGAGRATQAVIVETETNRSDLEREARDRVGITLTEGNVRPSAVVGVLFPDDLAYASDADDFKARLRASELEYFVLSGTGRFPASGHLKGGITDVVTAIRLSLIPKSAADEYASILQDEIRGISDILGGADYGVREEIAGILGYNRDSETVYGMSDEQAGYMAALMMLNAGMFYEELATHLEQIVPLSSLGAMPGVPTKHDVMEGMRLVLDVNYEPVFEVAIDLLNAVPDGIANEIISRVQSAVSTIMRLGMQNSGDVYGALYQNDLIERKKSASFYTRPEAAALLAGLVLPPAGDDLWSDSSRITRLRIGDFACGTGMLLTAAYNHIINCHGDDKSIAEMHRDMMTDALWGFDIMPTATHLTVSNLASLCPAEIFNKCRIYQMPIGIRMPARRSKKPVYALGSLDLIRNADADMGDDSMSLEVAAFDDGSARLGRRHGGRGGEHLASIRLKTGSFNYIMMNPPFVRATNHGGGRADPVPPFAVFGIPKSVQSRMSQNNTQIYQKNGSDGNAGLASHFIAISHQKIRCGGVMGFILPATISAGSAWSGIRDILNKWYDSIMVIRLRRVAGEGEATFSSGTGMEEVMLVARKMDAERPEEEYPRIKFIQLDRLPTSRLESLEVVKIIRRTTPNILEHHMGGTSMMLGDTHAGDTLDCPVEDGQWMMAMTSNIFLLQFAYSLTAGECGVKMIVLDKISDIGKLGRDIADKSTGAAPRAPFKKIVYDSRKNYPCLWNNKAVRQQTMVVEPDLSLEKKSTATPEHVITVWSARSRIHLNLQPRYTSQRLVAAYTERESIGGRSWPNIILHNKSHEKALTVWLNSVFGILTYWFAAGSQQSERALMSKTSCKKIPVPDFDALDGGAIEKMDAVFDDLCMKEMKPINMLDDDDVRREIDRRVVDILGLKVDNLEQVYDWLVHEKHLGRKDLRTVD